MAGQKIDACSSELMGLSKTLWENPEESFKEFYAHNLLTETLEKHGFQVTRKYFLDTAFRAEYGAGTPKVAILCEYDSLPLIGHGCGHNLIAEIGIAAALGAKSVMHSSGLPGTLVVLGTPAEEDGGGKVHLINSGAFDDLDCAMMSHPGNFDASQTPTLALMELKAVFRGRASHAASVPWAGLNALDAAVQAYTGVSCLRQQFKPSWRVHGIVTDGGVRPNIIPERAELLYYLRTPTVRELAQLRDKVTACFDGAATATGCTVEVRSDRPPYSDVITNGVLERLYRQHCEALGLRFTEDEELLRTPTGSTDMGNVSYVVPSIHPHYCITERPTPPHTAAFATAAGTPTAQPPTLLQAKAIAQTAVHLLQKPELLQAAKEELVRVTQNRQ